MNTILRFPIATALLATLGFSPAGAADWSHIMGPQHNKQSAEQANLPWAGGKPRQIWAIPAAGGFSSFVTGDGKAYTVLPTEVAGEMLETATAFDRQTGRKIWQTPLKGEADYRNGGERGARDNAGGDGPRATPVFAGDRVFVFGGKFDLYALHPVSGRILWQRDLIEEFGGREITWSNAAAPLVLGDRVLVAGGGRNQSFLAFRTDNGELLWKSGSDRATHSTPVVATIHGQQKALFLVERGLVALDPATGRELWHYPFPHRTATAASPVVWGDIINVTAGYGVGGGACQITRQGDTWEVTELWRSRGNRDTASHWSTAVVHEGYLYGCYGHNEYGSGSLKSIDIRTGRVMWQQPGFGHGQVILAGGRLLATTDFGRLVVIEPNPSGYRELARADVIEGKVWASPAVSDGQLLLRSTTQGVCLEL